MNKITTSVSLLALALGALVPSAAARDISKSEALRTAKDFVKSRPATRSLSGEVALAYAEPSAISEADCFYVFNIGQEGFVIVSGDSDAVPVLGYSSNGAFDSKNVPVNVAEWLSQYREEIDALRGHAAPATRTTRGYKAVGPLVETMWNQTAPYYNLCPTLPNDKGVYTHAYTGCVATAAAQILNYHKWPKGPGKGSYEDFFEPTASYDFESMNIDWDALTSDPRVTDFSSDEAKDAVANLMLAVGVAFDMQYSSKSSGSGAWLFCGPDALFNYFGYSKTIAYRERNGFTNEEWEAMLNGELAAGRPILYSGKSDKSGHAFVCDGYDGEGKYHFNWGWGGSYDGFFALNAMYPQGGGAGAGSWELGYNQNHMAVIGIQPPVAGTVEPPTFAYVATGALDYTGYDTTNPTYSSFGLLTTSGKGAIRYRWRHPFSVVLAMGIWDETGTKLLGYSGNDDIKTIAFSTTNVTYKFGYDFYYSNGQGPSWSYSTQSIATLMPTLGDGKYVLRPVARVYATSEEGWTPIQGKYHIIPTFDRSNTRDLLMTISGSKATYEPFDGDETKAILPFSMEISKQQANLKVSKTLELTASLYPAVENASALLWSSSDANVATVDKNGVVTGVAAGTAVIRAATTDGTNLQAFCTVTVSNDSGIEGMEEAAVKVVGQDNTISISGASEGDVAEVYTVAGIKIASRKCVGGACNVEVDGRGIYLVRVGNYQTKVRL